MQEIWKPIKGYVGLYEVSNLGNVRNAKGRMLKPFPIHQGYLVVDLCHDWKKTHNFCPMCGRKLPEPPKED